MSDDRKSEIHDENDPREPYEAPTLQCDELFETLSLACGKVSPVTANCQHVRKLS